MVATARGSVPVRSTSDAVHDLLARGLPDARAAAGGEPLPQGLGLRIADDGSAFHWLFWGRCPVVRTRDAGRLLGALEQHLSAPRRPDGDELILRMSAGVTAEGLAFILPALGADVARLERRLREAGAALVDGPFAIVDPIAGELVVDRPEVTIAPDAREELLAVIGSAGSEPAIPPGRYPVTHRVIDVDAPPPGGGTELAHLLGHLTAPATERGIQAAPALLWRLRTVVLAMRDVSRLPAVLGLEGSPG